MRSKNSELLKSFVKYCKEYPEQRFWQALRNWAFASFIYVDGVDSFYWEGRNENGQTE